LLKGCDLFVRRKYSVFKGLLHSYTIPYFLFKVKNFL
jgi:hypothetical protein